MRKLTSARASLSTGILTAGLLCAACGSEASGAGSSFGGAAGLSGLSGAAGSSSASGGAGMPNSSGAGGSAPNSGAAGGGGVPIIAGAGGTSAGGAGTSGGAGSAGAAGGVVTGKTEYAPYYELYSDTGAFKSLVDLQQKAGLNDVTLAFVLKGNGCSTDNTISDNLDDIKAFIAAGGHVKASFGGAAGSYVETGCADATALAGAIGKFVDDTGITDLDFDIEQDGPLATNMNVRRGQALKMLQDSKHIQVSFTLAVNDDGIPKAPLNCLTSALDAGVKVSHVNIMVMDYGDMPDNTPMAPIAIGSLNASHAQLKKAIPALTDEQAWAMLGATPDIGQNDDAEIFTLADAQALTDFAIAHKLGLITFWNIQRDQTCGKGECSEHNQANFDYHRIFEKVLK